MGKGSTRRPTDEKTFQENYDKIFGRKTASRSTPKESSSTPNLPLSSPSKSQQQHALYNKIMREDLPRT